jgi:hypothetical protein
MTRKELDIKLKKSGSILVFMRKGLNKRIKGSRIVKFTGNEFALTYVPSSSLKNMKKGTSVTDGTNWYVTSDGYRVYTYTIEPTKKEVIIHKCSLCKKHVITGGIVCRVCLHKTHDKCTEKINYDNRTTPEGVSVRIKKCPNCKCGLI